MFTLLGHLARRTVRRVVRIYYPKIEISGGERGIAFVNTHGNNMDADTVTLTYQGAKIEKPVPVWISPGQPDMVRATSCTSWA